MAKKILVSALLISLSLIPTFKTRAADSTAAQNVEQAFNAVKTSLDDLITAKDQNNQDDLALRIETFRKVIDLSISEAKDLKVKILSLDKTNDEEALAWRNKMTDALDNALDYYNNEEQILDRSFIDLPTIKELAKEFKDWRDKNYFPAADQISTFLLIQQEKAAVGIAEKRAQKISDDVASLKKTTTKDLTDLEALFDKANSAIADGKKLNGNAESLFSAQYIDVSSTPQNNTLVKTNQEETPNVSSSNAEETDNLTPAVIDSQNSSTTDANSGIANASSTEVSPPPPPSIKDLIKASLDKIKGAYQNFIEMSNLVRKLFS